MAKARSGSVIKPKLNMLFFGEPGVGKSLMADCLIKASGRQCFVCRKDKPDGEFVTHIEKLFLKL